MSSAITLSGPRVADIPAAPLMAVAQLLPARPVDLAVVRLRPAGGGRVWIEAIAHYMAVSLLLQGSVDRSALYLPRWAVMAQRRRHPDAERMIVEEMGAGFRLVSISDRAAVAVAMGEGPEIPAIPEPPDLRGPVDPTLLDPDLLAAAVAAMRTAAPGALEVVPLDHPVLAWAVRPGTCEDVAGPGVMIGRMVLASATAG